MAVINSGMKKVIKIMCVTCQTAQFISLMPKPKDFVTRIVGDVVLLSSKTQKLSDDINSLLDSYADIPVNYLMTQVNSITGSLNGVINRVNTYTQNAIDQTLSVAENTMNTISEITETTIDVVNQTTQAVESLGGTIAHTTSAILAQSDVASDIQDATEVIMEWTDGEFTEIKSSSISSLEQASQAITNAKTNAMNSVNDTLTSATDSISNVQKWVENLLNELKEKMDKLSSVLDGGFRDVTGVSSISTGASLVTDALNESGNDSASAQAVSAVSTSLSEVLKNFSISKVLKAFAGVTTQAVIVKTGLDQLPPIDFESMLCEINSDLNKTNEDLYNELNSMVSDVDEFNNSLKETNATNYSDANYKKYVSQFNEDIQRERDTIRLLMKNKNSSNSNINKMNERREIKSAIKEIQKFKNKAKKARQADKLSSIIGDELKNLKKEVEYCCNDIKSDWNDMMNQYKNAIKEIKQFFQNGGDGDMFIEDCCDAINRDCDAIKELCTNLGSQLIGCTLKVVMPADLGPVFPNPVYKLASFWMDVKTIFKFIKDLITLIIDILNNINKLARIMLNGINSLSEIISQLMDLLGLKWFMDLVQDIIDMFGSKISDARILLQNSLAPVYYKDTEEYDNTLTLLESVYSVVGNNETEKFVGLSGNNLNNLTDKKRYYKICESENYGSVTKKDDEKYDKLLDELDEKGEEIVAYRSPILDYSESTSKVSELTSGDGSLNFDVKFIGWHYFHSNLDHTGTTYYSNSIIGKILKKIKSKIIAKAAKKSNKTNGGVAMLKKKKVKKDSAYTAFYWYTYYTEDIEKDCYIYDTEDGKQYIDSVITTQNGSIVELDNGRKVFVADSHVRSGDYVNVNGVKYRVK